MIKPDEILDIRSYILPVYVPCKLSEPVLIIHFDPEIQQTGLNSHAQQQCYNLTFPFARTGPTLVAISKIRTLVTADRETHTKEVLELLLDTENTDAADFDYQPGDTIGILPKNTAAEVKKLLYALQLEDLAHRYCRLKEISSGAKKTTRLPPHIPTLTTPHEILSDCLNIRAPLKKQFLRVLAEQCSLAEERDFLLTLTSKEGSNYYNEIILEKGVTLLELLKLCRSCKPTLATLAEHLPRLLPRPYSIANSPHAARASNKLKIILSVLNTKMGVTTDMLHKMSVGAINVPKLLIFLRNSNTFRYTEDEAAASQILIGIGTGLAPFLGFLEHKQYLATTTQRPVMQGETWLFAGATTQNSIVHRKCILQFQKHGTLNRYFESISQSPNAPFRYVQQQIEANASEFIEFLIQPNTVLYVCADGGAKISKSIEATIVSCLKNVLSSTTTEATEMLRDFRSNGKYREDLWL